MAKRTRSALAKAKLRNKTIRTVKSTASQFQVAGRSRTFRKKKTILPTFFSKRYKLKGPIGRGGAGVVYKATDKVLSMDVAIKFLPVELVRSRVDSERFAAEARIAMQLSHEHIVKLHNLEKDKNMMYLVMELVDGSDFRGILTQHGAQPIETVIQIASCCSSALDYAHERGVLHQDLKPENLMLSNESILKIVDFGTARRDGCAIAGDGEFLEGSPPYMSPEQILQFDLDLRTDVYSFGAVVYELLSGHPPYPVDVDPQRVLDEPPYPLKQIDPEIAAIVYKAMDKDREERWETASEFYRKLSHAAGQEPD